MARAKPARRGADAGARVAALTRRLRLRSSEERGCGRGPSAATFGSSSSVEVSTLARRVASPISQRTRSRYVLWQYEPRGRPSRWSTSRSGPRALWGWDSLASVVRVPAGPCAQALSTGIRTLPSAPRVRRAHVVVALGFHWCAASVWPVQRQPDLESRACRLGASCGLRRSRSAASMPIYRCMLSYAAKRSLMHNPRPRRSSKC